MIHPIPEDIIQDIPEHFTDPFRYTPHPLVQFAAREVISHVDSLAIDGFAEGKMLGALIVETEAGQIGYLAGFSGSVDGRSFVEGFVPPVYDLLDPHGHYKVHEAEIVEINRKISALENSSDLAVLREEFIKAESARDEEITLMKARMAISKKERELIRCELDGDLVRLAELTKESQFQKAELRRLKTSWGDRISDIRKKIEVTTSGIASLKAERAAMSDRLQRWIFEQYIVYNAAGESSSIWDIFAAQGLVPPGGTGDCAAPKLLNHAFRNRLKPLAMGEFWYGRPSETAVRVQGHFYPSCTSKCGPLLSYMISSTSYTGSCKGHKNPGRPWPGEWEGSNEVGRDLVFTPHEGSEIIYEDEAIVIVEKVAGMPSVPGLDGRWSLLEWLNSDRHKSSIEPSCTYEAVHRLDMDTSGVMVFAKTPEAAVNLRKQFEEHTVKKTYIARLCPAGTNAMSNNNKILAQGAKGTIELPLSADYDERPRQKVDMVHGKTALTGYEVSALNEDGTIDIIYHPHTGRTHQLRVHSAHPLGLCRPIVGDLLYGGHTEQSAAARLHLHALSITLQHPTLNTTLTFSGKSTCY
ncbi:MAG: RNA pseudouridine synthase [Bacteroidales bacterium]|nr:RNA pseudouridine synthase [Bacteroidales bacterium]